MRNIAAFLCLFFFSFCFQRASAQQVSGTVIDDSTNAALAGVSVNIKDSQAGTRTNESGSFTLSLPENRRKVTLVISSVGYATVTANAESGKPLNIRLQKQVS